GYSAVNTDCNDGNSSIHPNAPEICNSVDDNCNGVVDENAVNAIISPSGAVNICTGTIKTLSSNNGSGLFYQWYRDGNSIPGATAKTYKVSDTTSAIFTVSVTNSQGCSAMSASTQVNVQPKPIAFVIVQNGGNLNLCKGTVQLQANNGSGYNIQWYKNAIPISGAVAKTYNVSSTGNYAVQLTNSFGCSNISQSVAVINTCRISDDTLQALEWELYPNPTKTSFTLEMQYENSLNTDVLIQIFNSIGRVEQTISAKLEDGFFSRKINFGNECRDGIYFVQIILDGKQYKKQIVLQH
ncbi:MAG: MopE-related protein, partial [Chitinophagales bacterium]